MSFSNPVTGGQGTLVRPAIKSPNYVPGNAGWSINRDGSAEFNNLTLRGTFNGTNYVINASGEFFYSAAPAFGNLIMSFAQSAGTDAFGNGYLGGSTVYDTANKLYINSRSSAFSQGTYSGAAFAVVFDTAQSSSLSNSGGGALVIAGPTKTASGFNDAAILTLLTGQQSQPTGGVTPGINLTDSAANSAADFGLSGSVIKLNNAGNPATWQTPSYGTGFAGGSTASASYQTLRFRLDAQDNVVLKGAFHFTAGAPANPVFTLPVGFRPAALWNSVPLWYTTAGTDNPNGAFRLQITAGGAVNYAAAVAPVANNNVYVDITLPLGNIA